MNKIKLAIDTDKGVYINQSEGVTVQSTDEYDMTVFGNIAAESCNNDLDKIYHLFKQYKTNITEFLQGQYILCIYEKATKTLYAFHDRTTSPVTLYYTQNSSKFFLSTSLKSLLIESKIKRSLEQDVLEEFLLNGFIYGNKTLVRNVFKLPAFSALVIKNGMASEIPVEYAVIEMPRGEALEKWEPVLSNAVNKCFEGKKEINMPLSSGFDSNYIAYIASTQAVCPINAFSIGGKFGKNELPIVTENVSSYRDMKLYSALTDSNTLNHFADIVWRLEGAVYEVGLFLQYELASLVASSGKDNIICGECADQVMNLHYLEDDRIHPQMEADSAIYYEFSEYPFIFGSFLILKKNGILANSFGIKTEYPYLDDEFVSVAHSLRSINGKDKRVHTAVCREKLPKAVVANMSKIGGATEFHSLFNDKEAINSFFAKVESSSFYRQYEGIIKKVSYIEKEKQYGLTRLKTEVRNVLLNMMHLNVESRARDAYFIEEMKLKEYMNCMYVVLFEKLFVSGLYDDQFKKDGINIDLNIIV